MAKARYFKASVAGLTVFRSSQSRVYASAWLNVYERSDGALYVGSMGFSSSPTPKPDRLNPNRAGGSTRCAMAAKIDKAEYDRLVAAKAARVARDFAAKHPGEEMPKWVGTSPQDSWVHDTQIDSEAAAKVCPVFRHLTGGAS